MNPDFFIIKDQRGIPLDVVLYYDQAIVVAQQLTSKAVTVSVVPVYTMDTLDVWVDEIIKGKLHTDGV